MKPPTANSVNFSHTSNIGTARSVCAHGGDTPGGGAPGTQSKP
jgi:hypothetical protein